MKTLLVLFPSAMADTGTAYPAAGLVVLVLAGLLYFLPSIIAASRKHHNALAIFWLNLLFGWAYGIGWVIALIWSLTAVRPELREEKPETATPVGHWEGKPIRTRPPKPVEPKAIITRDDPRWTR